MTDKLYSQKEYDLARLLLGKSVFYFVKASLPNHLNQSVYSYFPMMLTTLATTKVIGITVDIKKISDEDGERDEYRKLSFILKNPYYVEPEQLDDRLSGGGFPKCDAASYEVWSLSYDTLNQWFFESKELAMSSIKETTSCYLQP